MNLRCMATEWLQLHAVRWMSASKLYGLRMSTASRVVNEWMQAVWSMSECKPCGQWVNASRVVNEWMHAVWSVSECKPCGQWVNASRVVNEWMQAVWSMSECKLYAGAVCTCENKVSRSQCECPALSAPTPVRGAKCQLRAMDRHETPWGVKQHVSSHFYFIK